MDLDGYCRAFDTAELDFQATVERFGLPFEEQETSLRSARARTAAQCGCHCENGDSSLWRGWISPACLACRTGEETATFFIDLKCARNCYFCFNPNQDGYEHFLTHTRDIVAELEQAYASHARFGCLALTGGEPMMHRDQAVAFFRRAGELFPAAYTRLYTSGDFLDAAGLDELASSGLDEIRFSIKPDDSDEGLEALYDLMAQAIEAIPNVMVEVPVIPGTLAQMRAMLRRCDAIGVRGVNLLEFCFPLHNAQAFRERGFQLRRRPYNYLYNYWYGGGLPVAGSEDGALELLRFAADEGLSLGIHYCSSDNKNTGQIFQQNKSFFADASFYEAYPWMTQDEGDRFLKCAKAFGGDAGRAKAWADAAGVPYGFDAGIPCMSLSLEDAARLHAQRPAVQLATSVNVMDMREPGKCSAEGGLYLREVAVEPWD